MALVIKWSSLFETRQLKLDSGGIHMMKAAAFGSKKRIGFGDIDYVLMSADHKLSIQYGTEVFVIQTNPNKAKHAEVVRTLVQCAQENRRPA